MRLLFLVVLSAVFLIPDPLQGASVQVTNPVTAWCGADSVRRQPNALADFDRDGLLERVSVVREKRKFKIKLHRVPGLKEIIGSFTIRGDSIEVASTRCLGAKGMAGDLHLHVGVASDEKGSKWTHSLYHLKGGKLEVIAKDIRQSSLHLDLDGDGCVDPIVRGPRGGRVLLGGKWRKVPANLTVMTWWGWPAGHGQRQAVDLDGDGDRDILMGYPLQIVDAKSLEVTWKAPGGEKSPARLVSWRGRPAIAANTGETLIIFDTDAAHTVLARHKGPSYLDALSDLDPAGNGTLIALYDLETRLLDTNEPSRLRGLGVMLARQIDVRPVRLGPVDMDGDKRPDLLGVKIIKLGSPMLAFPGSTASYELVLLDPGGKGPPKVIFKNQPDGMLTVSAWPVDLDGDGVHEILLKESLGFSSCDERSHGSTSTLYLLGGDGKVLWKDEPRTDYSENGRWTDAEAHARPLELWGDDRLGIRVRAADNEWYLLPAGAKLPDSLPACLE